MNMLSFRLKMILIRTRVMPPLSKIMLFLIWLKKKKYFGNNADLWPNHTREINSKKYF